MISVEIGVSRSRNHDTEGCSSCNLGRNMAVKDKSEALGDAKNLYNTLSQKLGGTGSTDGGGDENPIGSLNKAVLGAVSDTVQTPLLGIMNDVHRGVEVSNEVKMSVVDLPGPLQKELEDLPSSLKVDDLSNGLSSTVRNVLETMKTVAADPKTLYPRLLCGSIPVDPAKLTNLAKKYGALDVLDANSDGNEATRAMRGPPGSTADIVSGFTGSFKSVADPLLSGVEKLSAIKGKLESTTKAIQDVSGDEGALDDLLSQQEKVGGLTDRLTSLFATTEPTTPTSGQSQSPTSVTRGLPLDNPQTDVIAIVEEGSQLLSSADNFKGPLEKCIERVKGLGEMLSTLGDELKDLFENAMTAVGHVVEHLRTFIKSLPRILSEIRQFFVPSGLRALFMQSSPETNNLLADVEKLSSSVPDPEEMQSSARAVLDESEALSTVELIKKKIIEVVGLGPKLISELAVLSEDLPDKVLASAKKALKDWAEEFGESVIGAKIEDGICDAVEAVAGEKLADAVADFLPFGDNPDSKGESGEKSDGGGFGGMLASFF